MKTLSFLLLLIFGSFACSSNKSPEKVPLDYCTMLSADQGLDGGDRIEAFYVNFNRILEVTKSNGFPAIDEATLPQDSCRYWAVTATLVHIAQTAPELMFNNEVIELFSQEIKKGNLDPADLSPAFRVSTGGGGTFCDSLKPYVDKSISSWSMKDELRERFSYIPCK